MHLTALRFTFPPMASLALVATLTLGCGGNGKLNPDASVNPDARSEHLDATVDNLPTDSGADVVAPPVPGPGSRLLVSGQVSLIGSGTDTCTNGLPPTGDRWCGFARASAILGASELWVVNVTQAAAGKKISCESGAADPNCVRLSGGLYSDSINGGGFGVNGFDGDTLTYEEVPSSSATGFEGNIFAWRPGWTAPRQLTANTGLACNGHALTNAVICVENPVVDASQTVETAELHAGFLDSQSGDGLPLVDTIILQTKADATGVKKWSARLSPDGDAVAWSTRADAAGTEDLKWQKIRDDQSRVMVAPDVDQWTISADSQKWFWLRTFNYDVSGAPSGTLQSAPYPGGSTTPVTIATNVGDYEEAGAKGVLYRAGVKTNVGELLMVPDRDVPATKVSVDTGVAVVFAVAKDGQSATYTKHIQSPSTNVFLFDAYVGSGLGKTPCTLTSKATDFLPPTFLSGGSMVAWGLFNSQSGEVEGVVTTLAGCITRKFASNLFSFTAVGDEGLVFLDSLAANPQVNEASLRYAKTTNGVLPATGTVLQARAGLEYAALLPALPFVLYTITSNTSADGLYLSAMLPFTTTPTVPLSDAGADTSATTEAGTDAGSLTEARAETSGAEAGLSDGGAETGGSFDTAGGS